MGCIWHRGLLGRDAGNEVEEAHERGDLMLAAQQETESGTYSGGYKN